MLDFKPRHAYSAAPDGTPKPSLAFERQGGDSHAGIAQQNWVLDPVQDALFIIAAPLLCLALAVLTLQHFGAAQGASLIIVAHIVMTVAHHLPTFIRLYGDVDLLQRFRWSILLAPVVPMCFAIAVLAYIHHHQYPVEYFLYLYIFLTLWDPWHFLRQHFGFMRIYDRNNLAPKAIASNFDWAICVVWFAHIMVASADWLPGLLEDLYRSAGIPLLLYFPTVLVNTFQQFTWWLAAVCSVAYGFYIVWCLRSGYFVSVAKLGVLICTFGVMYFTYIPNEWILQLVPAWSFKVGFATVGIVHMTQYLAIVWRYDRNMTQLGRARKGWFAWLHTRSSRWGVALAVVVYVGFCLAYGDFVTSSFDNRWLMSALLVVGFTSTLLHYYYDGFIWKIRDPNNQQALGLHDHGLHNPTPSSAHTDVQPREKTVLESAEPISANLRYTSKPSTWYSKVFVSTPAKTLLRQLLYFGVPMGILTLGAFNVWHNNGAHYVQRMYQAQALSERGQAQQASAEAQLAFASMQQELPVAEKLATLKPTSSNEAALAFLVFNESLYRNIVMPSLAGNNPTLSQRQNHAQQTQRAAALLTSAVYRGGELAHPGREVLTRDQALGVAASWRRQ